MWKNVHFIVIEQIIADLRKAGFQSSTHETLKLLQAIINEAVGRS
jgi:hypothetical protein